VTDAAVEAKRALRAELRERLAALDPGHRHRAGELVAARALAEPELARARRIFVCLSFGDELPTGPLVERLAAAGRELFVPRADPRDGKLHVHPYPCELVTLEFGLRQPRRGTPELTDPEIDSTLDAALVLGLGFDGRGYRLGYGRGYFDRFLAGRRFPSLGLAFDAQLVERLPAEPHDVPMRLVVTERRTLRPEPSA
jgi:5-formyltetrahydrofolate cyclo-ligase